MRNDNKEIRIPTDKVLGADKSGNLYSGADKLDGLFVGRVENLKELKKEGDKFYVLDDLNNKLKPMEDGNLVQQGFVMMSNINAVKEMTSLIETSRLVEMYQKVMTSHMDELNREAITKLATTRA